MERKDKLIDRVRGLKAKTGYICLVKESDGQSFIYLKVKDGKTKETFELLDFLDFLVSKYNRKIVIAYLISAISLAVSIYAILN